jgi:hypothetical protein
VADFKKMWKDYFQRTPTPPRIMPESNFPTITNNIFESSLNVFFDIQQTSPKLRTVTIPAAKKSPVSQVFLSQKVTTHVVFIVLNLEDPFG